METGIKHLLDLGLLKSMSNLWRWNGLDILKKEPVDGHSYGVVFVSCILSEAIFPGNESKGFQILKKSTFHDVDEIYSGDLNHNLKHDEEVGQQIRAALKIYINRNIEKDFPKDRAVDVIMKKALQTKYSPDVEAIVKLSDWISMLTFIRNEAFRGNQNLKGHENYCFRKTIEAIDKAEKEIMAYNKSYNVLILEELRNFL